MLPDGWKGGLSAEDVAAIERCEFLADHGFLRFQPSRHLKGYYRLTLPRRHPYARSGTALLHRYIVERHLGRRLHPDEHVHHRPGAALDTLDLRRLEVWYEREHAHFHYGERMRCSQGVKLWSPRDYFGRFTPLPTSEWLDESLRLAPEEA